MEKKTLEKIQEILYELLGAIEDGTIDSEYLGSVRRKITDLTSD